MPAYPDLPRYLPLSAAWLTVGDALFAQWVSRAVGRQGFPENRTTAAAKQCVVLSSQRAFVPVCHCSWPLRTAPLADRLLSL